MARKRLRGMGKRKGGAWERKVCVALSLWISGGKRDDIFWRSATSGGRATARLKRGKRTEVACGDVSAVHSMGEPFLAQFFVECKATANCHLMAYVNPGTKGLREDHWLKPCRQAADWNREPFVIVKQNGIPPMLWLRTSGYQTLHSGKPGGSLLRLAHFSMYDLSVYWFDDFLRGVDRRLFLPAKRRVLIAD